MYLQPTKYNYKHFLSLQPFPLFAKIEAAAIADYKKRFAGTQATRSSSSKPASQSAPAAAAYPAEAARLTKQVEAQVKI